MQRARAWTAREPVARSLGLASYSILATSVLLVLLVGAVPPGRGVAVELAAGCGYVALAILALQLALGARPRRLVNAAGLDAVLLFHRQLGFWASAFVGAHVALLAAVKPAYVSSLLDLKLDALRALALGCVIVGLPLLVLVPRQLTRLRIPYEVWRVGHGLLAVIVVVVALWHVLSLGRASATDAKQAVIVALVAVPSAVLLWSRLIRPLSALRRPWRVVEVRREGARTWTLVLEAVEHDGLRFLPGQSVWLTLGRSPFSPRQHPFTIASSATSPRRLELTIKELGDFTRTIGRTPVGTRAYVAGPYGAFALDVRARHPLICVAGGIGITPMMSMLRTLRDCGARRPVLLVYASRSLEAAAFASELDALARTVDLEVVHVLEEPSPGWSGERGRLAPELFDRLVTARFAQAEAFVCGPAPMMNAAERALRARGIPLRRIHAEHFALVGSRPPGRRSILEERVAALAASLALLLFAAVIVVAVFRSARGP